MLVRATVILCAGTRATSGHRRLAQDYAYSAHWRVSLLQPGATPARSRMPLRQRVVVAQRS